VAGVLLLEARREQDLIRLLGLILGASAVAIAILIAVVLAIGTGGGDASPGAAKPVEATAAVPAGPPEGKSPAPRQLHWIVAGDDLAALRADNAGLARRFFDNPDTFVVGSRQVQDQVPKGYRSIPILSYAAMRSFVADVHSGRVDPRIAAVLYDPESWARTPATERRGPLAAMREFTTLAGRWGYAAMLAPGRDLALDADVSCTKRRHEFLDQAFLRCGLVAPAGADAFVLQTAPEELQPELATALVGATRERLAAAGGEADLFATVSTAPPGDGRPVYPVDLVGAADRAIEGGAAGLMLNFGSGEVDLAASFLRDLEREGAVGGVAVSEPG
jgi:hypothetical protein